MAPADEREFRYNDVFGALDDVCRRYVVADMALLKASIHQRQTLPGSDMPVLGTISRLRAGLSFDVTLSATRRLIFGLIKKERSERVAEFDIVAEVAPALERGPRAPQIFPSQGNIPDFVVQVKADFIAIRLLDGSTLRRRLASTTTELHPHLNAEEMGQLFMLMAAWNAGRLSATARPFAERHDLTHQIFHDTVLGVHSMLANMDRYAGMAGATPPDQFVPVNHDTVDDAAALRAELDALLGSDHAAYAFDVLSIRIKASLDEKGNIATEPLQVGTRRYDLVGQLLREEGQLAVRFDLRVPDLHTDGPLHAAIFDKLLDAETASKFTDEIEDEDVFGEIEPSVDEWCKFVREARDHPLSMVIRIERHADREDFNMLFMAGRLRGEEMVLAFQHKIKLAMDSEPANPMIEKLSDPELVLEQRPGKPWKQHVRLDRSGGAAKRLKLYFQHVFHALHAWVSRFE